MEELSISFFEGIKPLIEDLREKESIERDRTEENSPDANEEIQEVENSEEVAINELKEKIQEETEEFIKEYTLILQEQIEEARNKIESLKDNSKVLEERKNKYNDLRSEFDENSALHRLADIEDNKLEKEIQDNDAKIDIHTKNMVEYENELKSFNEIMGNIDFSNSNYISTLEEIIHRNEEKNVNKNEEKETDSNNDSGKKTHQKEPIRERKNDSKKLEEFFAVVEKYYDNNTFPDEYYELKDLCKQYPMLSNIMLNGQNEQIKEFFLSKFKGKPEYDNIKKTMEKLIKIHLKYKEEKANVKKTGKESKPEGAITRIRDDEVDILKPAPVLTMDDLKQKGARPKEKENGTVEGEKSTGHQADELKKRMQQQKEQQRNEQQKNEQQKNEQQKNEQQKKGTTTKSATTKGTTTKSATTKGTTTKTQPTQEELPKEIQNNLNGNNVKIVVKPTQDLMIIYIKDQEPKKVKDLLKRTKEGKILSKGRLFYEKNVDKADLSILKVLDKLEEKGICQGVVAEYLNSFNLEKENAPEKQQIDSIKYIFDRNAEKAKRHSKIERKFKKYAKTSVEYGIAEVEKIDGTKGKFHRFIDRIFDKVIKPKRFPTAENKKDAKDAKISEEPKILSKAEERRQFINNMPKSPNIARVIDSLKTRKAFDILLDQDERLNKMKRGAPVVSSKFVDKEK